MNKKLLCLYILFLFSYSAFSQTVGIGTATPDTSAALDVTHVSKGLLIPRMNSGSILTIPKPAKGLLVYDSLLNQLMVNIGTPASPNFQSVASSIPGWALGGNVGVNPTVQFVGTTDIQPLRFRINNIPAGELNPVTGNIFWGFRSGINNISGFSNIAIGPDALNANTNAANVIAIGDSALFNNGKNSASAVDGSANVAVGSKSLFANTTGNSNTAAGIKSLTSNTTGNLNTAMGSQALLLNTAGFQNTGIGAGALQGNTTGSDLTAVGVSALASNTTGFVNTAMGFGTLFLNTTGSFNSAFGEFAMHDNVSGNNNTAVGNFALQFGTTGHENTGIGVQALKMNTTGFFNTALGMNVLVDNTTGFSNTGIGDFAMQHTITAHDNIAGGINAMINLASGVNNTAYGNFAGDLAISDTNNVFIGFGANNTSGQILTNSVALGAGSSITASNQVRLGNGATTSIGGAVGFTTISDARFKKNIEEKVKGIDFIMRLRPVTYQLDIGALNSKLSPEGKSQAVYKIDPSENEQRVFTGFVAQEVEQAAKDAGYDFSGIDKPKNANDYYGLRYSDFVAPLVKAFQEQQQVIEELKKINDNQKILNAELLRRLEKLESSSK